MHGLTSAEALLEIISRIVKELPPGASLHAEINFDSALSVCSMQMSMISEEFAKYIISA
jgi:hypothetical protein